MDHAVGYGMSETCGTIVSHRWAASREEMRASTGRLLPGARLRVVDPDTGESLGAGTDGELAVAGPTVLDRYVGKPARTRWAPTVSCAPATWGTSTPTAGALDRAPHRDHQDGGRERLARRAGIRAAGLPGVRRAKVVGLPDRRLGEVVVLCAEPAAAATPTEQDLKDFLRARVAAYKVPRHVLFFAPGEMPTTGSDTKIRDADLVALAAARLAGHG